MKFRISAEAREEIRHAAEYLTAEAPAQVALFFDDIARARALIVEHPNAHPRAARGCHRILLARHPYQLVYRVEGDVIHIYAVAHLSRRPRYWGGRVK